MDNVKKKLLLLALCLSLFFTAIVQAYNVRCSNVQIYVPASSAISFQNEPDTYLTARVTAGQINSSVNTVYLTQGRGTFRWTAVNDSTVLVTFTDTVSSVEAEGDSGNSPRKIPSGTSLTVLTGNNVIISWNYHAAIWLPLMFIFGMSGVLSMFGGSLYAVSCFKKKRYYKGFYYGVIFIALGFGLTIAWLWSG